MTRRAVSDRKGQVSIRREPPTWNDQQGREDDWLADEGELDWVHDPRGDEEAAEPSGRGLEPWPQAERPRPAGLVRVPQVPERASPETFVRRRRILVLSALAAAFLIAIVVIVVATGGGGGGNPLVQETTAQTQPATSPVTTAATTTTTTTTTPSLHVTVPAGGNLSVGDNGPAVLTLQKALAQLGFDVGTPDGDFGSGTQDAVIAFQQAHNLKPDGIVGTDTAKAINDALVASPG